jgi:enoyl-CoA hydratase/carnithine racemase
MTFASRDVLLVDDADGVRLLTLHRPDRLNAFNQALWCATRDALADAAGDPAIACVVITGAGRAFSAGQDLTEMADPTVLASGDEEPGYRTFMPVLESFPKPLLAAVNGVGVGIGLTMLLHCDLVLMAESARLRAPFVSLGVTTEASASLLLPATIGWQEAAHLLFTEPWIDATTAHRLGLAWRVVTDEALLDEALTLARTIATMPVRSLEATKRLMLAGRLEAVRAARLREEAEFERLVGAPENREALEKFFGG